MSQFTRPTVRVNRGCHADPIALSHEAVQKILRAPPARSVYERQWTPPIDYLTVARDMPHAVGVAYIKRCEEWYASQTPRPTPPSRHHESVDTEAICKLLEKFGTKIPLEEYRAVGYTEAAIEKVRARRQWYDDHGDDLEAEIERRWPGSSKPKSKKVIKAVKKKMP